MVFNFLDWRSDFFFSKSSYRIYLITTQSTQHIFLLCTLNVRREPAYLGIYSKIKVCCIKNMLVYILKWVLIVREDLQLLMLHSMNIFKFYYHNKNRTSWNVFYFQSINKTQKKPGCYMIGIINFIITKIQACDIEAHLVF